MLWLTFCLFQIQHQILCLHPPATLAARADPVPAAHLSWCSARGIAIWERWSPRSGATWGVCRLWLGCRLNMAVAITCKYVLCLIQVYLVLIGYEPAGISGSKKSMWKTESSHAAEAGVAYWQDTVSTVALFFLGIVSNSNLPFQGVIFMFYVNLWECLPVFNMGSEAHFHFFGFSGVRVPWTKKTTRGVCSVGL